MFTIIDYTTYNVYNNKHKKKRIYKNEKSSV